jgi:hypothetical protein
MIKRYAAAASVTVCLKKSLSINQESPITAAAKNALNPVAEEARATNLLPGIVKTNKGRLANFLDWRQGLASPFLSPVFFAGRTFPPLKRVTAVSTRNHNAF